MNLSFNDRKPLAIAFNELVVSNVLTHGVGHNNITGSSVILLLTGPRQMIQVF